MFSQRKFSGSQKLCKLHNAKGNFAFSVFKVIFLF